MSPPISPATSRRWFGTGHSASADPTVAGTEAVAAATQGRPASLILVFCSVAYDLKRLLSSIRAEAGPDATITGCSAQGQIAPGCPSSGSVVVAALGGPGFQVRTRVSRNVSSQLRAAGVTAARGLEDTDRPYRALMLICDGLTRRLHQVIWGAYSVVGGGIPIVGGCSADDLTYDQTYQFHSDGPEMEILSDAVIGVALGSDAPLGAGIAHGWRVRGEAMVVTDSQEGRLYKIDYQPALDVYLRLIGEDRRALSDSNMFREIALRSPLGLARPGSEDIRVIHGANQTDGSLDCLADVPQGALIWQLETDHDALVAAAGQSGTQAVDMLGGASPIGLLTFDCGGRKVMLGEDGIAREAAQIQRIAVDTPFCGFYTYGEIARTHGPRGMHHLTFVTLALA